MPPPKVHVEVIKKGALADPLSSSVLGTMDGGMKDEGKGEFSSSVLFGCCISFLTIVPKWFHRISMI